MALTRAEHIGYSLALAVAVGAWKTAQLLDRNVTEGLALAFGCSAAFDAFCIVYVGYRMVQMGFLVWQRVIRDRY